MISQLTKSLTLALSRTSARLLVRKRNRGVVFTFNNPLEGQLALSPLYKALWPKRATEIIGQPIIRIMGSKKPSPFAYLKCWIKGVDEQVIVRLLPTYADRAVF
jgi:hypothetical protein